MDSQGCNVFEGGFLGLNNITVIDHGPKLPGNAVLEQSDDTGWMGFFCLYLTKIGLHLHARFLPAVAVTLFGCLLETSRGDTSSEHPEYATGSKPKRSSH